jgi:hypothetical protein
MAEGGSFSFLSHSTESILTGEAKPEEKVLN